MSLNTYHLKTISPSRISLCLTTTTPIPALKNPNFSPPVSSRHFTTLLNPKPFPYKTQNPKSPFSFTLKPQNLTLNAYQYDNAMQSQRSESLNLDDFLPTAEFLSIISSAIVTIIFAVKFTVMSSKTTALGVIGSTRFFSWGLVLMVSGMAIGAWIRRRQWRRICRQTVRNGGESVNLLERIEKLEEDLRSSATIIRVLSRQLEKLGIRFRVTRKALKEPIAETAALAQKNSEATQALAVQEDFLEKELVEIQKVLLAMQEQQQKQLDLILAIGHTGKLLETKHQPSQEQDLIETSDLTKGVDQVETHEARASGPIKGTNNDRP